MGRLRLLIVAGAQEGEALAQAAAAAGISASSKGPAEAVLDPDLPTSAQAVLFATGVESETLIPSFVQLRRRLGDACLTFVLGDSEGGVAEGLDPDVIFTRPMDPDLLMSQIADCLTPMDLAASVPGPEPAVLPPLPISLAESPPYPPTDALELLADGLDLEIEAGLSAAVSSPENGEEPLPLEGAASTGEPGGAQLRAPGGRWDAGELGAWGLVQAMARAYREGFSGRLRLSRGGVDKAIFFEAGRPVLATSSHPADRLVEVLMRKGRLSADERRAAIALATQSGRKMGAVLVELGILKRVELLPVLRLHYEEIILSMFAWQDGTFEWDGQVLADPRNIRLLEHPAWLLALGLGRARDEAALLERLGSIDRVLAVSVRPAAWEIVRALDRNPAWARIIRLIDGVRSLGDVVRVAEPVPVLALALALLELGAADEGAAAALPARLEVDRERLLAWIALARDGDYFQVLGVPRGASTEQIRQARRRMSAALAEGRLDPTLRQGYGEDLVDLEEVLTEAGRVLEDEGLRQAYLRALAASQAAARVAAGGPGRGSVGMKAVIPPEREAGTTFQVEETSE